MSTLFVIIFGAVVGFAAFFIKGSGYGLLWDISLGVAGSIIASCVMAAGFLFNHFGRADVAEFSWYGITIGTVGALIMIYSVWLYKRAFGLKI